MRVRSTALLVCVLMLAAVAGLWAQTAGRITGSVVDPSGAAIAGATVNLVLPGGTSPLATTKTNAEGYFDLAGLRPETYDLNVEMTGFRTNSVRGVKVETVRVTGLAPIRLELSSVTQTVEVSGAAETVQTASVDVALTLTRDQVRLLPMANRSPQLLLSILPGVANSTGAWSIQGQRPAMTNITLDGINVQDNFLRDNTVSFSPMLLKLDQVSEFTVIKSNASAAFGNGSAQVVFATPSGTNQYHGSLIWQNRNSALAANSFFNNKNKVGKSQLNQNQFGGSVGGPVLKDKLFFYTNFEALRLRQQSTQTRTILTQDARNGIYTYSDSAGNVRKVNVLQAAGVTTDAYMRGLLERVPGPENINNFQVGDSTPTLLRNTAGYSFKQRANRNTNNLTLRMDYNLSSAHSFSGTWARTTDFVDRTGDTYNAVPTMTNDDVRNLISTSWRWNPTPAFTNHAGGGFLLSSALFLNTEDYGQFLLSGLLYSNPVNTTMPQGRQTDTYNFWDNAGWVKGKHNIQFGMSHMRMRVAPYNDAGIVPTFTLGLGNNGVTLATSQFPGIGSTDFSRATSLLTNLSGLIDSYSQTFNVTSRDSGYVPRATNLRHFLQDTWGFYVQDTWKVTPRFTLNAGLRYEYFTPVDERDGLSLQPRLIDNNPIHTLLSNATLDFAGKSLDRPFYKGDRNNFAPNLGVTWDPFGDQKTAIRAAYSIHYSMDADIASIRNSAVSTNDGLSSQVTAAGVTGRTSSPPAIPTPVLRVPRTFSDNYNELGTQVAFAMVTPNLATPYVQQWSFGIQRDVKGIILEARYVGNHATKLLRAFDLNQVQVRENGFLDDFIRARNNGFAAVAAGSAFNPNYNAGIPGSQPLTVFPRMNLTGAGLLTNATVVGYLQRGEVGELANYYAIRRLNGSVPFYRNPWGLGMNLMTNYSNSTYNAFEFESRGRYKGLQLQGSYTFSKNLSDSHGESQTRFEAFLDEANPGLEKARTAFDLTHQIKGNWIYELPMGAGRFVDVGPLNRILGGWSASGIVLWQSGTPFSILSARPTLNRSARSGFNTAITTASADQLDSLIAFRMTGNGPVWIDPSAKGPDGRAVASDGAAPFAGQVFFNPGPGQLGSLQRRMFSGPWTFNMDFGLQKKTQITERHSIEIRMEATNIFNHATFWVGDERSSNANFNVNSATFGNITSSFYGPRVVQLGVYYRF